MVSCALEAARSPSAASNRAHQPRQFVEPRQQRVGRLGWKIEDEFIEALIDSALERLLLRGRGEQRKRDVFDAPAARFTRPRRKTHAGDRHGAATGSVGAIVVVFRLPRIGRVSMADGTVNLPLRFDMKPSERHQ